MRVQRSKREQGSSMLEFGLCLIVLGPALLGMFTVGMNLNRNMQAIQVARDAGHMFVRSVDFTETSNQRLLARLGKELNMIASGTVDTPDPNGGAVIILTKIHVPTLAECLAAGRDAAECVNIGLPTISQRVVVGNESLKTSTLGQPPAARFGAMGCSNNLDILTSVDLRAVNVALLPPIPGGQDAYIAEVYAASPDFDLAGSITGTGVYARAIY